MYQLDCSNELYYIVKKDGIEQFKISKRNPFENVCEYFNKQGIRFEVIS